MLASRGVGAIALTLQRRPHLFSRTLDAARCENEEKWRRVWDEEREQNQKAEAEALKRMEQQLEKAAAWHLKRRSLALRRRPAVRPAPPSPPRALRRAIEIN